MLVVSPLVQHSIFSSRDSADTFFLVYKVGKRMFIFHPFGAETNKKAMENQRQRAIYLQTRLSPPPKKKKIICFCRTNLQ